MSESYNFLLVTWMNPDYITKEEMTACNQLNFTSLSLPYIPRIGDTLELSKLINKRTELGELQEGFIYRVIAVVYVLREPEETQRKALDYAREWELHLLPISGL